MNCSKPGQSFPKLDLGLLFLLACLFLAGQMLWSVFETFGEANLVGVANSLAFYKSLIAQPGKMGVAGIDYPYLSYLTSSVFYAVLGFSAQAASLSLLAFIFILVYALYGLGYRFGGRLMAWLLVFLTLGNARTIFWSHSYTQNFPEMAMVCLAFYLLVENCDFKDRASGIYLGLALGLAWLTKYGVVFLLTPILWRGVTLAWEELKNWKSRFFFLGGLLLAILSGWGVINLFYYSRAYLSLKNHFLIWQLISFGFAIFTILIQLKSRKTPTKPWANFACALLIAAFIALPWYIQGLDVLFRQFGTYHATALSKGAGIFHSLHDFLVYAGLLFPGILWFLPPGVIFCLYKWREIPYQLLLAGCLGALLLLSKLILDPTYYNFFSLIPFIVLVSICWVDLWPGRLKIILVILALLWFAFNFSGVCLLKSGRISTQTPLYPLWQKVILADHRDRFFNLEDTMFFAAVKERTFNHFSRIIQTHYPPKAQAGMKILFLNLVPRLILQERQMEIYLAAQSPRLTDFDILEFRSGYPSTMFPFPDIPNLSEFKNYGFYTPWDFLLIAAPKIQDFPHWEKQVEAKGFTISLLGEETNRQAVWGGLENFTVRLYALKRTR